MSGRDGYFALLRSTNTHDIVNNSIVRGPATITVGPGVKAVEVRRCQPWQWLGDNLDAVIAAASEPGTPRAVTNYSPRISSKHGATRAHGYDGSGDFLLHSGTDSHFSGNGIS